MSKNLTVEVLQALTPFDLDGQDLVTQASRDLLLACIKSQPDIHSIFFPSFEPPPLVKQVEYRAFPIDSLATSFLAEAIGKIKDPWGFHKTINLNVVADQLREVCDSIDWKKIGFQLYTLLYPDVVKDRKTNVSLRDFMNTDGAAWAERLTSVSTCSSRVRALHQSIVTGQSSEASYNRDVNRLLLKLHLLDPQSVIPAYQCLLAQRALPVVNLELATRNYLGGLLDWSLVEDDVRRAESKPRTPLGSSRLSLTAELEVFHGMEVEDFITTRCADLGLWNGTRPDNCRLMKARDRCLLM